MTRSLVKKAFTRQLPVVTVTDKALMDEYNLLVDGAHTRDHPLIRVFDALTDGTKNDILRLVASIKANGEGQKGGGEGGNDNMLELHNDKKKNLSYPVLQWVLVLVFGLFLVYTAAGHLDNLKSAYGLSDTEAWDLVKHPIREGPNTVQIIMINLLEKMKREAAFQVNDVCNKPQSVDGNVVQNIGKALSEVVTFFAAPNQKIKCASNVISAAGQYQLELERNRVENGVSNTVNVIVAAYPIVITSSVMLSQYILGGTIDRIKTCVWSKKAAVKAGGTRRQRRRTKCIKRRRTNTRTKSARSRRRTNTRTKSARSRRRTRQ